MAAHLTAAERLRRDYGRNMPTPRQRDAEPRQPPRIRATSEMYDMNAILEQIKDRDKVIASKKVYGARRVAKVVKGYGVDPYKALSGFIGWFPAGSSSADSYPFVGRKSLIDTESYPERCVCQVWAYTAGGTPSQGSGVLISPNAILCSAHQVVKTSPDYHENGLSCDEWAASMAVVPGRAGDREPHGAYKVRNIEVLPEYFQDDSLANDLAILFLQENVGTITGYMGVAAASTTALKDADGVMVGYGGTGDYQTATRTKCDPHSLGIWLDEELTSGCSGGPVYLLGKNPDSITSHGSPGSEDDRVVVGIMTGGKDPATRLLRYKSSRKSHAARITAKRLEWILENVNLWRNA